MFGESREKLKTDDRRLGTESAPLVKVNNIKKERPYIKHGLSEFIAVGFYLFKLNSIVPVTVLPFNSAAEVAFPLTVIVIPAGITTDEVSSTVRLVI